MAAKKKTNEKKSGGKKLETLSQTHGMVEKTEPTTLAQIWGDTGLSKYGTLDVDEYKNQLSSLNKTDLMAHAQKLGLIPVDNSKVLRERLIREFNRHVVVYKKPASNLSSDTDIDPETRKILEEGR